MLTVVMGGGLGIHTDTSHSILTQCLAHRQQYASVLYVQLGTQCPKSGGAGRREAWEGQL